MTKRPRRNHRPTLKAKVALAAIKGGCVKTGESARISEGLRGLNMKRFVECEDRRAAEEAGPCLEWPI